MSNKQFMSRKLLLIDDTPEIAELLSFSLRDRGYDVAVSGYDTSINELVVREQADALVLDCSIYNMSESLFDALRDDERHADLPVVIITDTSDVGVASLRSRRARRVRLVPKPFSGSDVVRALEELFEAERAPAEGGRA